MKLMTKARYLTSVKCKWKIQKKKKKKKPADRNATKTLNH